MCQPEGFEDHTNRVCKLNKSLYGLKQSSRVWNETLNSVLVGFGLKRCEADQCIYYSINGNKMLFIAIYVDDVAFFYNDHTLAKQLKAKLCKSFKMKDLGQMSSILGIRVTRNRSKGTINIDQSQYISQMFDQFNMTECNPVTTPLDVNTKPTAKMCPATEEEKNQMKAVPHMEAIGSLLYTSQITRPDICYAVNLLSRFSKNPGKLHWLMIKRIFRYLKGTIGRKITYNRKSQ